MQKSYENGILTLRPAGHVDAVNAPAFQAEILELLAEDPPEAVVIDCDQVEYMSSAGLRSWIRPALQS